MLCRTAEYVTDPEYGEGGGGDVSAAERGPHQSGEQGGRRHVRLYHGATTAGRVDDRGNRVVLLRGDVNIQCLWLQVST